MRRIISFEQLLIAAIEYIEALRDELNLIICNPQYPQSAQLLAKTFRQLADKASLELQANQKKYDDANIKLNNLKDGKSLTEKEKLEGNYFSDIIYEAETHVESILVYFKFIAGLLRYISTSSIDSIPQGLLYPFQNIIENTFPKAYIFLRKQWKHNYKYGEFIGQLWDAKNRPDFFDYIENEFNFKLCMVSYPSLEDDNYLYNCNIAHEVGHYLNDLNPLFRSEEEYKSYQLKHPPSDLEQTLSEKKISKQLSEIGGISYLWYEEFMADVYATLMLGPAYLFSFLEFNETSQFDIDYFSIDKKNGYPSPRMRLYFIMKTLNCRELKLIKFFKDNEDNSKLFKIISEKFAYFMDETKDEKCGTFEDEYASIAWLSNKEMLNKIIKHAINGPLRKYVKTTLMDSNANFNIGLIENAQKKFNCNNPINEILETRKQGEKNFYETRPMSIYQILNLGWMKFFELLNSFSVANEPEKVELKEAIISLKLLIKRSVESSYMHQKYQEQKNRIEL